MNPENRKSDPVRLTDEAVELIAAELRVLAEPSRIRLIEHLNRGDATVQELSAHLGTTHQNISKHLGVLFQAGCVSRTRDGLTVRYSLIDWTGWWVVEQIGRGIADRLDARRERLNTDI